MLTFLQPFLGFNHDKDLTTEPSYSLSRLGSSYPDTTNPLESDYYEISTHADDEIPTSSMALYRPRW